MLSVSVGGWVGGVRLGGWGVLPAADTELLYVQLLLTPADTNSYIKECFT